MKFILFFKDFYIATVEQTDADFPNLIGRYELGDFNGMGENADLLKNYISYSIKLSKCIEDADQYSRMIENEEYKYLDLIDSEDWYLMDKNKEITPILVPVFYENNEINWRYA